MVRVGCAAMASPVQFGVFVPQGWKMELAGISGAEAYARYGRLWELGRFPESRDDALR